MDSDGVNDAIIASSGFLSCRSFCRCFDWKQVNKILKNLQKDCELSLTSFQRISDSVTAEMITGLSSNDTMINIQPAYIRFDTPLEHFPRNYIGLYYNGSTEFSMLAITRRRTRPLVSNLVLGNSVTLEDNLTLEAKCDAMAEELRKFIPKVNRGESSVMTSETVGFMSKMADKVAVGQGLQRAINSRGLQFKVFTIVDESVLGLCFRRVQNDSILAAINVGNTTNAVYVEKGSRLSKHPELDLGEGEMVVLVDWKNFTSVDFPTTAYDISNNADSPNPNQMVFEKLVTGRYMGEVVRKVILQMIMVIDKDFRSELLATPFALTSDHVTKIKEDKSPKLQIVSKVFADVFQITNVPFKFLKGVAKACDIVSRRSALLNAAAILGFLEKYGYDQASGRTVGLCFSTSDSSYKNFIQKTLSDLVGNAINFSIELPYAIPTAMAAAIAVSWHTPMEGADQSVELD